MDSQDPFFVVGHLINLTNHLKEEIMSDLNNPGRPVQMSYVNSNPVMTSMQIRYVSRNAGTSTQIRYVSFNPGTSAKMSYVSCNPGMPAEIGHIKEAREVRTNKQTGEEETWIDHHIQDPAHIQKVKNNNTDNVEVNQGFVNLNEAEANAFDREGQNGIQRFHPYRARDNANAQRRGCGNRRRGRKGKANAQRHGCVHDANGKGATRREMNNPPTEPRRVNTSVRNHNVKGSPK